MPIHFSSFKVVIALVVALLAVFAQRAEAIGCGVSLPADVETGIVTGTCDDWQCSRNFHNICVMGFLKGERCSVDNDCYNLACNNVNTTTGFGVCGEKEAASKNVGVGLVGAAIGVICFGSSFVPIKKYKKFAGDGVFAQFLMCFGRFIVGVVVMATRDNHVFYWDAALGGALWCLGNVMSVPIIQCVGIGLGVSIWGTTNMLLGWASGHWGWWGIKAESSKAPALEYLSVAFSALGIVLFLFVKPVPQMQQTADVEAAAAPKEVSVDSSEEEGNINGASDNTNGDAAKALLKSNAPTSYDDDKSMKSSPVVGLLATANSNDNGEEADSSTSSPLQQQSPLKKQTLGDTLGPNKARIIGVSMALAAGCLYGICMDPAQHMMTRYDELTLESSTMKYSPFGLDYVFSNNVGAMTMSSAVLVIYLILQKFGLTPTEKYFDKVEHAKLLLPAFAAGAIGSIASAAWFFANQNLGLVVSFPIVAAGPGVVSSLWGALVFKELRGVKNFAILGAAFVAVILSAVFSSLGKIGV